MTGSLRYFVYMVELFCYEVDNLDQIQYFKHLSSYSLFHSGTEGDSIQVELAMHFMTDCGMYENY